MKVSYARAAPPVLAALCALFLVDLFLEWCHVQVGVAPVVNLDVATTGWNGWGWVAGLGALALLLYVLLETAGYIPQEQGVEIAPAVLAIVVALAAAVEYRNVASVEAGGVVVVDRGWPATAGLVLAGAIAVVAVGRLLAAGPAFSGRSHPAH